MPTWVGNEAQAWSAVEDYIWGGDGGEDQKGAEARDHILVHSRWGSHGAVES